MVATIVGSGLKVLTDWPIAPAMMNVGLVLYVFSEVGRAKGGAQRIGALCVAVGLAVLFVHPLGPSLFNHALLGTADLVAFFAALSFLHLAARSSPLIQTCGSILVRQPPSRRYLALNLGAHLISLVLSFGVLNLLGVMVTQGNTLESAGGDRRIQEIRKARMMSALLRGFVTMLIWSPVSVAFAVIHKVVEGIAWNKLILVQTGLAFLVTVIGWLLDRTLYPNRQTVARTDSIVTAEDRSALGRLAALIAVLMGAVLLASHWLDGPPVIGIIVIIPLAAYCWLLAQFQDMREAAPLQALKTLGERLSLSLPQARNEVLYLGGAMFLGLIAARLLGHSAAAHWVAAVPLPPLALTILLPWLVMIAAQAGVPQIFSISLLGGAVPDLVPLGIHPLALASGLMAAWALSAGSTPVGAAVTTIARQADVPVRTVTIAWNGLFVLLSALFLGIWIAGVSWLLG